MASGWGQVPTSDSVADQEGLADLGLQQIEVLVIGEIEARRGRIGRFIIGQEDSDQEHGLLTVNDSGYPAIRLHVRVDDVLAARPVWWGLIDPAVDLTGDARESDDARRTGREGPRVGTCPLPPPPGSGASSCPAPKMLGMARTTTTDGSGVELASLLWLAAASDASATDAGTDSPAAEHAHATRTIHVMAAGTIGR